MNKEFFEAVEEIAKEKSIDTDYLYEKIANGIIAAVKHDYNGKDIVHCDIDPEKKKMKVYVTKDVVEEVEDPDTQLTLAQAQAIRKSAKTGKSIDIQIKTKDLGRIAAQTAKHVIRQGIREAEKANVYEEFKKKDKELVSAVVNRVDPTNGTAVIELGKTFTLLPWQEQIPGETLREGDNIKVFIMSIDETPKGPRIMVSRANAGFVKRLFENEVPEIFDGTVEIKAITREAGVRTKIAVYSNDENVDALGACIGPRGQRIANIVDVLGDEKVDIINYSENPAEFVAAALSPSDVDEVEIVDEKEKICRATVPADKLSLAIGAKGQNVRLAAKLTGWKIDIKADGVFQPNN
ncbi:MAG: transcription termination factor NusA [Clostridiales bacterium]|nr:transcription termination factor NusA [Clostridiales bacterium]